MERNKRSFIMRDIIFKNIDGCTNNLKTFKIFLIFNFQENKILHFFSCIFIFS